MNQWFIYFLGNQWSQPRAGFQVPHSLDYTPSEIDCNYSIGSIKHILLLDLDEALTTRANGSIILNILLMFTPNLLLDFQIWGKNRRYPFRRLGVEKKDRNSKLSAFTEEEGLDPVVKSRMEVEGPVTLRRRLENGFVRIGGLSWGTDGDLNEQSEANFLATLTLAVESHLKKCDLIVAAGLSVNMTSGIKPDLASRVHTATRGIPVLFEVKTKDYKSWYIVHDNCITLVRLKQFIETAEQFTKDPERYRKFSNILNSRAGEIRFHGLDVSFVLFICGENNALEPYKYNSVIRHPDVWNLSIPMLKNAWIVINPSHKPYGNHYRTDSGFAKVGIVKRNYRKDGKKDGEIIKTINIGPMLKILAERTDIYGKSIENPIGTVPPKGVIHINNYTRNKRETHPYSAVGFGTPISTEIGDEIEYMGDDENLKWKFFKSSIFEYKI